MERRARNEQRSAVVLLLLLIVVLSGLRESEEVAGERKEGERGQGEKRGEGRRPAHARTSKKGLEPQIVRAQAARSLADNSGTGLK